MIEETRVSRLLKGYRGSPPADVAALERLLLALVEAAPRIAEIDLNPALAHPNGEGISLIDARVRLGD